MPGSMPDPVLTILKRWPDRDAVLADARTHNASLAAIAVYRWFKRKSIPIEYWNALVEGAERRGLSLSHAELVEARIDQRGRTPATVQGRGAA